MSHAVNLMNAQPMAGAGRRRRMVGGGFFSNLVSSAKSGLGAIAKSGAIGNGLGLLAQMNPNNQKLAQAATASKLVGLGKRPRKMAGGRRKRRS